MTIFDVFNI